MSNKTVLCNCEDFKANIDKVNAGFTLMAVHGSQGYNGKKFQYCPWCGKELKEEANEETRLQNLS